MVIGTHFQEIVVMVTLRLECAILRKGTKYIFRFLGEFGVSIDFSKIERKQFASRF